MEILSESNDIDTLNTKWNPFSQDTLVKIGARGVNHVKTASVTHLGCTRSIEQMRKNANFPVKIGVIRRASRWKTTSWRIGIAASSLQAG